MIKSLSDIYVSHPMGGKHVCYVSHNSMTNITDFFSLQEAEDLRSRITTDPASVEKDLDAGSIKIFSNWANAESVSLENVDYESTKSLGNPFPVVNIKNIDEAEWVVHSYCYILNQLESGLTPDYKYLDADRQMYVTIKNAANGGAASSSTVNNESTTMLDPYGGIKKEDLLNYKGILPQGWKDFRTTWYEKQQDFFLEFKPYTCGIRLFNTAIRKMQNCRIKNPIDRYRDALRYIKESLKIQNIDDMIKESISLKIESPEFKEILESIALFRQKPMNKHLVILYGAPGTGKTTYAVKKSGENNVTNCTKELTGADLARVFGFDQGNPTFNDSLFKTAIENGQNWVFDEFGNSSYDLQSGLKGLTDNKVSTTLYDRKIDLSHKYIVYLTMNLVDGDTVNTLPEALVDRAMEVREWKSTPAHLSVINSDYEEPEESPLGKETDTYMLDN